MRPQVVAAFLLAAALAAAEPAWFLAPPPDDGRLQGRGLGADEAAARQAAVADLAGQLLVTVDSERTAALVQTTTATGADLRESFATRTRLRTRLRDLPGVEVRRREAVDGVWYVQVAADRAALAAAAADRLAGHDRSLAGASATRPAAPDAEWAGRARSALALAEERAALAALLAGLGRQAPPPPVEAAALRAALGGLASPPQLRCADAARSPGLALGLARGAGGAGAAIAAADQPGAVAVALAETRRDRTTLKGWAVVELDGTATFSRGGAALGALSATAAATSTQGADEAYRRASTALAEEFAAVVCRRLPGLLAAAPPPSEDTP